jgi:hypothetical protein
MQAPFRNVTPRAVSTVPHVSRSLGACASIAVATALVLGGCSTANLARKAKKPSVDLVQLKGSDLGWGGVFLGRTRAEVETAVGHALPVKRDPNVVVCGEYHSLLTMLGRKVEIQWSSAKTSGTVDSIYVLLTAEEQATPVRQLATRLRTRLPSLGEAVTSGPNDYVAYITPRGHPSHAVMIKSIRENFLYVALADCFD